MSIRRWVLFSVVAVLAAITFLSSAYVVDLAHDAIVIQFGRVVTTHTEPGLYFKTPFIQDVIYIDRRLREWDGEPSNLNTAEKQKIVINTWARWRVTEPRRFYEALRTESAGQGVLDGVIDSSVKNVISVQPLMEALRNSDRSLKYREQELEEAEMARGINITVGRDEVVKNILGQAGEKLEEKYGVVIEGLSIKSFNYVNEVIPTIYERMRSERHRIANLYESEGREREAEILGQMAKELEEIESQAERQAKIVRGEADAEVIRIYAEAYGRDPDLYSFMKTLELYSTTLGKGTKVVLGTDDNDFFRFLKTYRKKE